MPEQRAVGEVRPKPVSPPVAQPTIPTSNVPISALEDVQSPASKAPVSPAQAAMPPSRGPMPSSQAPMPPKASPQVPSSKSELLVAILNPHFFYELESGQTM